MNGHRIRPPRDPRAGRELGGWRDAGDWERFRDRLARRRRDDGDLVPGARRRVHPRQRARAGTKGVSILHFLGGTSIELAGDRAIAQTKMTISQRGDGRRRACDVVCTGRFYDFFERRAGRWGIVLRQPIYEKDRIDPVDPAAQARARPGRCWRGFPTAIATSPTSRRGSATPSSATCRNSQGPRSSGCTRAAAPGSPAAPLD